MIKLALPTGDLRSPTSEVLSAAGLYVEGYGEGSRQLRSLPMPSHADVRVRVFRERDIPVQVALGNYDLGVTSLSWVTEMQVRFPQQPLVALADLRIGMSSIYAASSPLVARSLDDIGKLPIVRLASDLPNIAEAFARAARLPRYRVHAVAGAAQAYPPEDADVVIIAAKDEAGVRAHGLEPLLCLLDNSAWLIANARSLAAKDLTPVLSAIIRGAGHGQNGRLHLPSPIRSTAPGAECEARDYIRMAVPDGHQQPAVWDALRQGGLEFEGYEEKTAVRRPTTGIEGLEVKVIRPQDMPQAIAFGEFDLAITGRDLLYEHKFAFPSSPAIELVDLQRGQYNLSAVVDGELPADTIGEALAYWRDQGRKLLTVAAELPATGDHYARSRQFWRYQVIPIAGASEGFVPEDADLLIEGTETGKTIEVNNLKIIDNIYRSTTCVIGRDGAELSGRRREVYGEILARMRKAAGSVA